MKRFLAFLCTLMLLLQPVGGVHAEGETSSTDLHPNLLTTTAVQCEQCGGNAQFTQMIDAEGGHKMACSHGVVDENSFQAHQYEWVGDETQHWQQCTVGQEAIGEGEAHYANCDTSNPNVCAVCGKTSAGMSVSHGPWELQYTDVEHWYICTLCKVEMPETRYPHVELCSTLGVCVDCNKPFTSESISHSGQYVYTSNETEHWMICPDCKKEIPNTRGPHQGNEECSKSVHECVTCGDDYVPAELQHNYSELKWDHNADGCWPVCPDCNGLLYSDVFVTPHYAACADPSHCGICGAELDPGKTYTVQHTVTENSAWGHDNDYHWRVCDTCGKSAHVGEHETDCTNPQLCTVCQAADVGGAVVHRELSEYQYDSKAHWRVCSDCGEKVEEEHYAACDEPTVCMECGYVGEDHYIIHDTEWHHDIDKHWSQCMVCGEVDYEEGHYAFCTDPDICDFNCDASPKIHIGAIIHFEPSTYESDQTNHWYTCVACGEKIVAAHFPDKENPTVCTVCGAAFVTAHTHDWVATETAATCLKDGSIVTSCVCGESTTEVIPAMGHDWAEAVVVTAAACTKDGSSSSVCKNCDELSVSAIPALGHQWKVTDRLSPTCTADGYRVSTCSACAAESTTTLAATGHNYDIVVYVSQNNGAHGTNCLNGCGTKKTEECTLVTTTIGNMLCSACAVCGYAEYTMQSAASELIDSDVSAEIEIVRIENAVIAPVAAEEALIPEDTELVVHLTVPAVPLELDSEVQGKVEKLFAVNLISEGTSIQPTGKVRLSIPYEETEELDVNVMKLMLLCEDGTLMEIEYELIDGMIVFDTDLVGVFALMRADELL